MKRLLAVYLAFFSFAAQAQIVPSIPYNLTNGSLADATQVMGNFNTIVTDVNANAATNGANSNITSLTGLTTPLAHTYGGTSVYTGATTGGSGNAQTLATVTPSNFALTAGNVVTAIAGFSNSGAMTLNVNSQGATATRIETTAGLAALVGGEVVVGQSYTWMFDGTYLVLLNPSAIANGQLATAATHTFKGNITGGSAVPTDVTYASVDVALGIPIRIQRQVITATGSSTYTPCTGLLYGDYELWGAGGGGGGSSINQGTGAGGGAGGYARKIIAAATIGSSQTVVIGTGGTAGAAAAGTGGTGVTSTFGAILSVTGGAGGAGNSTGGSPTPGAGGVGTGGDINTTGAPGGTTIAGGNLGNASSSGGNSSRGGAGAITATQQVGANAVANSGSGASGAISSGSAETGGVGGSGFFSATEYCSQ